MNDEENLAALLARLNAGETEALNEWWERYGSALCRRAHNRLKMRGLHVSVESMDVCQSILLRLVTRIGEGKQAPIDNLEMYLDRAVTNEIRDLLDRMLADRRDRRRVVGNGLEGVDLASDDTTPSQRAFLNEVSAMLREELPPADWQVWELRRQGRTWPEIADQVGEKADSLRIRLERELTRIWKQRGLGDETG